MQFHLGFLLCLIFSISAFYAVDALKCREKICVISKDDGRVSCLQDREVTCRENGSGTQCGTIKTHNKFGNLYLNGGCYDKKNSKNENVNCALLKKTIEGTKLKTVIDDCSLCTSDRCNR